MECTVTGLEGDVLGTATEAGCDAVDSDVDTEVSGRIVHDISDESLHLLVGEGNEVTHTLHGATVPHVDVRPESHVLAIETTIDDEYAVRLGLGGGCRPNRVGAQLEVLTLECTECAVTQRLGVGEVIGFVVGEPEDGVAGVTVHALGKEELEPTTHGVLSSL